MNAGASQQWNWLCENSELPEVAQEAHSDTEKCVEMQVPLLQAVN